MYSILPEHDKPLTPESVTTIYRWYGINNYHQFWYTPENIESIHEIMK